MTQNLRPFLFGLLGLLATACASTSESDALWESTEVRTRSQMVLYQAALESFERSSFPLGSGADPAGNQLVSGWRLDLAPFRGKGFREKAYVKYELIGEHEYTVSTRVQRDINMDIVRPVDPSYAQWEPAPDNVARAREVLQRIVLLLGDDFEVGPAQKKRDPLRGQAIPKVRER